MLYSLKKELYRRFGFKYKNARNRSTSITKMFNQHSRFLAFHEEFPELIELSTKLAENPQLKDQIYGEITVLFMKRIWEGKKRQIIVHSDHLMWILIEFLANYFPNSNFIHLMRNPYDSVHSFLPRGGILKMI